MTSSLWSRNTVDPEEGNEHYEIFESGHFWALQSSKTISCSPPRCPHRPPVFGADTRTLSRRCWRSPAGLPAHLWKIGERRRIGQRHWCRLRQRWSHVAMTHRHACPCPRGRRPQQSPMPASPSRVAAPSLYSRVGGDGGGGGRSGGSDEEDDVARSRERRALCLFLVFSDTKPTKLILAMGAALSSLA